MPRWAVIFLVVALIAALLGFTSVARASAGITQTLLYIILPIIFLAPPVRVMTGGRILSEHQNLA